MEEVFVHVSPTYIILPAVDDAPISAEPPPSVSPTLGQSLTWHAQSACGARYEGCKPSVSLHVCAVTLPVRAHGRRIPM